MKILMVSIFSQHFFNWTLQLKDSPHEVFWLDVLDMDTKVEKISFVKQTVGWRIKYTYPGRYWIKKNLPMLHSFINRFNKRDISAVFEKRLKEINPDVVHSFEMYSGCVPILSIMEKNKDLKWIYSTWGNDFFYNKHPKKKEVVKRVYERINFMFSDTERDVRIARENGFSGKNLGTFPGGGGFYFDKNTPFDNQIEDRKIILVKGYQNKFGRCNNVLEALYNNQEEIKDYKIVVFGANKEVTEFAKQERFKDFNNLIIHGRIGGHHVRKLMANSLIYIGNSISDGMPNTLLEAIVMGVFPIQSNPGGATAEIIKDGKNGLLIEDPENILQISNVITKALGNLEMIRNGVNYNLNRIRPRLEREVIQTKVKQKYDEVDQNLFETSNQNVS